MYSAEAVRWGFGAPFNFPFRLTSLTKREKALTRRRVKLYRIMVSKAAASLFFFFFFFLRGRLLNLGWCVAARLLVLDLSFSLGIFLSMLECKFIGSCTGGRGSWGLGVRFRKLSFAGVYVAFSCGYWRGSNRAPGSEK